MRKNKRPKNTNKTSCNDAMLKTASEFAECTKKMSEEIKDASFEKNFLKKKNNKIEFNMCTSTSKTWNTNALPLEKTYSNEYMVDCRGL